MDSLLPPRALQGLTIGVSVSESEDLPRLGLSEAHIRLALAEIVRAILIHGGRVLYGGHLRKDGYTDFLIGELERFGSEHCFVSVLPWSEHLSLPFTDLWAARQRLGAAGEIICLNSDGLQIPVAQWVDLNRDYKPDKAEVTKALTAMRKSMTSMIDARVIIGGKRHGFLGNISGILEEIILAIESEKPLYLAGGFGGLAFDVADMMGLATKEEFDRIRPGMEMRSDVLAPLVQALADKNLGTIISRDGLASKERALLTVSHRASDLASLMVTGLGRINIAAGKKK
jgi:SLOG cluster2